MKAVILAGGYGSRLAEETTARPKPLVQVGGKPILWHIMKIYSFYGIHDFVICCGYLGYMIKEYFANYFLHMSDVTIDMASNKMSVHSAYAEPWRVTLVDTGKDSMTGGRLLRVRSYLEGEDFCMTYGDGVGNVDIASLLAYHNEKGAAATMTVTAPPGRFGAVIRQGDRVTSFEEKPKGDGGVINAGFFVLTPKVFDYLEGDHTVWESDALSSLAADRELAAFDHQGFWRPMDTIRDKYLLEDHWKSGKAPWAMWERSGAHGRTSEAKDIQIG